MRIKDEEIVGIYEGERLLCRACANEQGIKLDDSENFLLSDTVEHTDDLFFCDNCKKQIEAA